MNDDKKVIDIRERITAHMAEQQKDDEHLERVAQATRIYSRAIQEMLTLGLDKPEVVRMLRVAIEILEE